MNVISIHALSADVTPSAVTWSLSVEDKSGIPGEATASTAISARSSTGKRPLHRLREVRRREGITHAKVARTFGISVRDVQDQEQPSSDLRLSDLYRWEQVLEIPAAELLHEPDGALSPPVQLRARLLRMMKTVRSIQDEARETPVRRLAKTLADQLVELMPELKNTTAWPSVGQRRKETELGEAFFRGLLIGPVNESECVENS